jgi:hypothetical protein
MKSYRFMSICAIIMIWCAYTLVQGAAHPEESFVQRMQSYWSQLWVPSEERGESAQVLYADIPITGEMQPSTTTEEEEDEYQLIEPESPLGSLQTEEAVLFIKNSSQFNLYVVYHYADAWTSQVVEHGTLVPLGLVRKINLQSVRFKTYGKYMATGAKWYTLSEAGTTLQTLPDQRMVCLEVTLNEMASFLQKYTLPYVVRFIDEQPPRYTTLAEVFARAYNKLSYKEQLLGASVTQTVAELTASTSLTQHLGEQLKQGTAAALRERLMLGAQSRQLAYAFLGSPWANGEYYRYHEDPVLGPKMKANIEAAYLSRFDSLNSGLWVNTADDQLVDDVLYILLSATRALLTTTQEILPPEELVRRQEEDEEIARRLRQGMVLFDPNRAPQLRVEQ